MTNVALNKLETIKRCLKRVIDEYAGNPENLKDITKQDSIVLNIQRACEACISLAMHIASLKNLGVPQHSRQAFELLAKAEIIDEDLAGRMKAMVGFRNTAVHDYQSLKLEIIQQVIEQHLQDFVTFSDRIAKTDGI